MYDCVLTADPTEMVVTWVTQESTKSSVVEYGEYAIDQVSSGTEEIFQDGGSEKRTFFIHRVVLRKLSPATKYGRLRTCRNVGLRKYTCTL